LISDDHGLLLLIIEISTATRNENVLKTINTFI